MASKSFSTATLFVLTTLLLFFTFTMASCPPKYKKPKKHTPKYRRGHSIPKFHPPTPSRNCPTPRPDFPTPNFPTPNYPTPNFPTPNFPPNFPTPNFPPNFPTPNFPPPNFARPPPNFVGNPNNGKCPMDALKLNVCANVLNGLVNVIIGTQSSRPCCSLLQGLVDLDAAICLCTAIKANVLGINLNVPLSLSALVNQCGRSVPSGFQCP